METIRTELIEPVPEIVPPSVEKLRAENWRWAVIGLVCIVFGLPLGLAVWFALWALAGSAWHGMLANFGW